MMVTSEVEIANLALAKMGHEGFITSLTENSKGAKYMNVFYEPMRDELLRSHLWRFARKRAVLAPLTIEEEFGTGYKYFQYPDDCIRIVGTDKSYFQSGEPWDREGNKILANTSTLKLVYLKRVTNVAEMDPSFVDTFATRLAFESVMPIMKDSSLKEQLKKDLRESLVRAAHASAVEQDGERFIAEVYLEVR